MIDIARPSEYAKTRFMMDHGQSLEDYLTRDMYQEDETDNVLEYLDELVSNHKQTDDEWIEQI